MARKNTTVCNTSPAGVAAPMGYDTLKRDPKIACVNLYVSGLATIKKTSADMNEYFAFSQGLVNAIFYLWFISFNKISATSAL